MSKKLLVLAALPFALMFGACQEEPVEATPSELPGTSLPGDVSPISAQTWLDEFSLGHATNPDSSITAGRTGDDFAPGAPIHLSMETTDAPPNTTVRVLWYGPAETILGEEQKSVLPGGRYLSFQAPDTSSWAKGDYRVEVWVGDEKVNTQQFQIVDAAQAGT